MANTPQRMSIPRGNRAPFPLSLPILRITAFIRYNNNMNRYQSLWNEKHNQFYHGRVAYDDLLPHFFDVVESARLPVVDLACGVGNNSLYLSEHGKRVVACDYSAAALDILKKHVPQAATRLFDLTEPFPLADHSTDLIVSDMGLHFFDEATTFRILAEMRRILTEDGFAILRVNALEDMDPQYAENELERHFVHADDLDVRYFDEADIARFFGGWRIQCAERGQMTRYQGAPREVWRLLLQNGG